MWGAIRGENRLPPQEPARDRKTDVDQRHRERHHGCRHAEQGGRLLGPDYPEATQREPDDKAAGVTQKNRRRGKVIPKETQQTPDQRNRRHGKSHIVLQQSRDENCQRGKQPHTARETVKTVDQIERVGGSQQPKDRQRICPPRVLVHANQIRDQNAARQRDEACHDLPGQLLPWPKTPQVVNRTHNEHQRSRREDLKHEGEPLVQMTRHQAEDQKRKCVTDDNGQSAGTGNRSGVYCAVAVGMVDEAEKTKEITEQRCQQQRQRKRDDAKPDQRVHKNPPQIAPRSHLNSAAAALLRNTISGPGSRNVRYRNHRQPRTLPPGKLLLAGLPVIPDFSVPDSSTLGYAFRRERKRQSGKVSVRIRRPQPYYLHAGTVTPERHDVRTLGCGVTAMSSLHDLPVDAVLATATAVVVVAFGLANRRAELSRRPRPEGAVLEALRDLLALRASLSMPSPGQLPAAVSAPAVPAATGGISTADATGDQLLRLHTSLQSSLRTGQPPSVDPASPVPAPPAAVNENSPV